MPPGPGYETIMMNSNPETVSTDYDTSSRLYFEPLTVEDVLNVIDKVRGRAGRGGRAGGASARVAGGGVRRYWGGARGGRRGWCWECRWSPRHRGGRRVRKAHSRTMPAFALFSQPGRAQRTPASAWPSVAC